MWKTPRHRLQREPALQYQTIISPLFTPGIANICYKECKYLNVDCDGETQEGSLAIR